MEDRGIMGSMRGGAVVGCECFMSKKAGRRYMGCT